MRRYIPPALFLLQNFRLCSQKIIKNNKFNRNVASYRVFSTSTVLSRNMEQNIFSGSHDRYGGVIIDSEEDICTNIELFSKILQTSLKNWIENNKRGIWFKVHLNHSEWVPILAQNKFKFHHAKEDYVMMYRWLPNTEQCSIPSYATTMVGAGAVVLNEKNEILVVRDKHWNIPHWKLPGGFADPGENIVDAAIREVYEETNILTQFESLLSFRHGHNGMWDCSDLYLIVSLKALSNDIKKCDREIEDAQWMKVDDFVEHPDVPELTRFSVKNYFDVKKNNIKIECTHGFHKLLNKPYTLYYVVKE